MTRRRTTMREISKDEADDLQAAGTHGFWATWANPLAVHPDNRYVVCVGDKWYDMEPGALTIKFEGLVRLPGGKLKQAHTVLINNTQLAALVQEETAKGKQIDLGAGVPTVHTDNLKPQGD
jgi:hypothetical protein